MKIDVVPRAWLLERAGSREEKALMKERGVISLNTPEYTRPLSMERVEREDPPFSKKFWGRPSVLLLWFHDVDWKRTEEAVLFSEEQARKIASFFREMREEGRDLLIHCRAGVSRSQAVGMVLNDFANRLLEDHPGDLEENDRATREVRRPNILVLRLLTKAMEEEFKEELTKKERGE